MLTNEDIKILSDLMDKKLEPIKEQLDIIKEDTEITRAVVNELVEWVDYNFRDEYPFPVDKKKRSYIIKAPIFGVLFHNLFFLKVNIQEICQ